MKIWKEWRTALVIAQPATVVDWQQRRDVKVTHVVSSIGAPTPPDQIEQLRLRVVDEHGHEFRVLFGACPILHPEVEHVNDCLTHLESDAVNRWLAGGEARRLLLIDQYIAMFQKLDEDVARGKIVSTNARIDPKTAQGYITLADIAAFVKARAAMALAERLNAEAAKAEAERAKAEADRLNAEAAKAEVERAEALKKCQREPPQVVYRGGAEIYGASEEGPVSRNSSSRSCYTA